jgi:UDP-glucose 4-epimerase
MRFLVTGATGFVGSNLINALVAAHGADAVTAVAHEELSEGEKERLETLRKLGVRLVRGDLMTLHKGSMAVPAFDVVYHLAAYTETETLSERMSVNNVGTGNLLEWLSESLPGKRFIYTGTLASVDRLCPSGPLDETAPCTPKTAYGQSKLAAEDVIRSCRAKFGYDYTVLRVCTVLGKGYRPGGMFGVFPQMLARRALPTRLNWPGQTSFIEISDLVQILFSVPTLPQTANELYVVSNGEDPSFDKLLDQMAAMLGLSRNKIELPKWFWSLTCRIVWLVASTRLTPYRLQILCWRLGHMISDDMNVDAAKLNAVIPITYQTIEDGLRQAYSCD